MKPAGCMSLVAPAGHHKQMSLAMLKERETSCKVSSSLPNTPGSVNRSLLATGAA